MDPKSLTADFRDFLKSLNDYGVEYLLIGCHAVAYHCYLRPTQDLDVWIAVNLDNARRAVTLEGISHLTRYEGPVMKLIARMLLTRGNQPAKIVLYVLKSRLPLFGRVRLRPHDAPATLEECAVFRWDS